jgi:hypothetical protein
MRKIIFLLLLFGFSTAFADPLTLTSEEWAHPRSGEKLARQPALAELLKGFEREADSVIVIAHATSEAGQLWAEEWRAWLVALGVSSARVRLMARPEMKDALSLDVRKRADL